MKKLWFLFLILLMILCANGVSAKNISRTEEIGLGETKVISVPEPEGDISADWVYFEQIFLFTPEETGTYRLLMDYEEDQKNPYNVSLACSGSYYALKNGIEFDAQAGQTRELSFQYPIHDGRYPQITFRLGTADLSDTPQADKPVETTPPELTEETTLPEETQDPVEYVNPIFKTTTIEAGQVKTVTVPTPEGEIDKYQLYFDQKFVFRPEKTGTYRFMMRYQEDAKPYNIILAATGSYDTVGNGIEFHAVAGLTYDLHFQYPVHDGRYPQVMFYLDAVRLDPPAPQTAPPQETTQNTGAGRGVLRTVLIGVGIVLMLAVGVTFARPSPLDE